MADSITIPADGMAAICPKTGKLTHPALRDDTEHANDFLRGTFFAALSALVENVITRCDNLNPKVAKTKRRSSKPFSET